MKRFVRFIATSVGVTLVLVVVVAAVALLTFDYLSDRQNRRIVESISRKLAPVIPANPNTIWDTDLIPFGFPQDNFDSPYLAYEAPITVAMSKSQIAVTFRKSRYVSKQLVQDGHLITLSFATGSVLAASEWAAEWKRTKKLAPSYERLIGVGPYVYCCTADGEFYGYSDGYLVIRNGKVAGRQEDSPVSRTSEKAIEHFGTNGRLSTIEITHKDGSKSIIQTGCGGVVHSWFISKETLVITTDWGTVSVARADGGLIFSDGYDHAHIGFGGASSDGKRFILAVSAWHAGDPSFMTDEWLVVYDIDHRAPVFALKSAPLPYVQSQSGLSEDGTRLLTGSGGHLKLLRLPH